MIVVLDSPPTRDFAAIWIFDENDPEDSVVCASLAGKQQIDAMINQIYSRLERATG